MGFNRGRSESLYGGAPTGASPVPNLPPGGLVGVIAQEERERGGRRGNPNGPGGFGYNQPGSMPIGMMQPMGHPNQQMLDIMQQNNMMMAQMMEMQKQMQMMQTGQMPMQGAQGMPMPGLPPVGGPNRPMSMANSSRKSQAPSMYNRSMSFMGLQPGFQQHVARAQSVANYPIHGLGLQNGNYAPSVAPSERSNIGQPSRYKPVNTLFGDGGSTITAGSTIHPSDVESSKKKGLLSAVMHTGRKGATPKPTDDDEEDWGMPRKRKS